MNCQIVFFGKIKQEDHDDPTRSPVLKSWSWSCNLASFQTCPRFHPCPPYQVKFQEDLIKTEGVMDKHFAVVSLWDLVVAI